MTLATPYALHAVTPAEHDEIERQLATAPELVARAFAEEVRAVRETMATVSASTAIEPPEHLRGRLLASVEQHPLRAVPPLETPGPVPAAPPAEDAGPLAKRRAGRRGRRLIGVGALDWLGVAARGQDVDRRADLRRAGRANGVGRHPDRRHRHRGVLP